MGLKGAFHVEQNQHPHQDEIDALGEDIRASRKRQMECIRKTKYEFFLRCGDFCIGKATTYYGGRAYNNWTVELVQDPSSMMAFQTAKEAVEYKHSCKGFILEVKWRPKA